MKEADCRRIYFGIESADEAVLQIMNKKHAQKTAAAVATASTAGLKTVAFPILRYPGDTDASVLTTIKFTTSLPLNYISFTLSYPLPGTTLYGQMKNRINREWERG